VSRIVSGLHGRPREQKAGRVFVTGFKKAPANYCLRLLFYLLTRSSKKSIGVYTTHVIHKFTSIHKRKRSKKKTCGDDDFTTLPYREVTYKRTFSVIVWCLTDEKAFGH